MPGRRWMILAVLFAARAATGFQFQSIGSTANLLMQDLGINYSEIGMLLGAYLLPGIVVAFPAGLLGQRFREKKLGLAGLAMMAISGAALSFSDGFVAALVARTIGGVGATIVVLVATKMTVDWFDSREIVLAMSLLADELAVRGDAGSADPGHYRPASRMARGDAVQRRLRQPRALLLSRSFRSASSRRSRRRSTAPGCPLPFCFRSRSPG